MLGKMIKRFQRLDSQKKKNNTSKIIQPLSKNLTENLNSITNDFEACSDIIIREFKIGNETINAFLVMIKGITDNKTIDDNLLRPLMFDDRIKEKNYASNINTLLMYIKDCVIPVVAVSEVKTLPDAINTILSGNAVLFIDMSDVALSISQKAPQGRKIIEPVTEGVVRGPREGFVESIDTNIVLLRRKIKNSNLKFEAMNIGKQTQTVVCITYIKGIANDKFVKEVRERLSDIEMDSVLESGYIESFLVDAPFSIFPTVGNSEKPDIISAKILEGRIAILVDGTPFALTVPYLFVEAFHNAEDYYSRPFYATFMRCLRFIGFLLTVFIPAIYVALTNFNAELIPPSLLVSMAAATEGTPFPTVLEALLMQIIYQILREGGIRMPRPIGQAVSIVGALVIGESAVSAGIISSPMVIVIALTAVSSYVVPTISDANDFLRIGFLLLAGFEGLVGIMLGVAGVLTHLCSLRSLGVPYTSPFAPFIMSDQKDVLLRVPWWAMRRRARSLRTGNSVRVSPGQKPENPKDSTD